MISGLPIGNLSSQFFANVYLNALDQHAKHRLRARHYGRYVDDFYLLQATPSGERQGRLSYALFDLLLIDGVDISKAPLIERKTLLEQILGHGTRHLSYSSHAVGDGEQAFELAGQQDFEGIISKRADRAYHSGRGDDWRKTKALHSDEYAVVGWTAPKGRRSG